MCAVCIDTDSQALILYIRGNNNDFGSISIRGKLKCLHFCALQMRGKRFARALLSLTSFGPLSLALFLFLSLFRSLPVPRLRMPFCLAIKANKPSQRIVPNVSMLGCADGAHHLFTFRCRLPCTIILNPRFSRAMRIKVPRYQREKRAAPTGRGHRERALKNTTQKPCGAWP